MSKISTYEVVPVPKLSDKLIGTSVGGEIEDVTYNFTLLELLELFLPVIPANNLQGVLDYGNTATQDINLFGTITTTNLEVTDTANLFITYLNEETHIVGSLFDSADSVGTAGQVLTSTGDGVEWFTLPPIFTPNLEQVLTEGNTSSIDILLDANLEALDVSADTATVGVNLTLGGTITDNSSAVGSAGQVLSSTVTGVAWVSLPVYSATSPLLFNSATGVFSIQVANSTQGGYLTANDWVTFDGKQNAGAYITALTGEATATGPGSVPVTLNNASVTAKVLTGLNVTGGSISASDSILTAFGKVQSQINGLMGGVQYQGVWDAATNTPTLTSSVGTQGHYYIVNVAGNTDLNGITDWKVGDWAIFSGGTWQKVDNTESVTSVNGQTGAVSLTTDNIPEGATNLYYLDSRARGALSFAAGSGAYNSLTGVITIPTNNNQILNGANYITLASLSATSPLLYNNLTGVFSIPQATALVDGYLSATDWSTFNNKQNYLGGTGLVKSTAGTITYITDNSGNWNTAYNRSIVSAAVTGTTTKTLTLNEQDGNTITASWTDLDTGLTSVGVSMPSAFSVANSPLTSNGTIAITGAGTTLQYIDGTGALRTFPGLTGYVPYTGATQNVDLGEFGISAGYFQADLTPTGALQVGRMQWNSTDGTMDLRLLGNNVTLQIGQENVTRVVNKSGIDLLEANYQVVRVRKVAEGGAQGQRLAVVLAQGNNENNSTEVLGLVTETINVNQEGFVTAFGEVKEINTTGSLQGETWVDGDILYVSTSVAGQLTNIRPVAPNHAVTVGYVTYAHANHGKIYMAIDTGYELGELHNVYAPSPAANASIWWNTSTLRYENNTIAGILGYTPANPALYVPYTGATGAVNLGSNAFTTLSSITGGGLKTTNGVQIKYGDVGFGSDPDYLTIESYKASTVTSLRLADGDTLKSAILIFNNSVDYNYTFPNASGTLALTSDLTGGTVTSVAALTLGTSGTDLSSTVANPTTTPVITLNVPTASAANRGALSAADWSTFNTKVGGVTASSPLASSGGQTPNITIQQSSGSQNGYLSSTDWTTFNNKQAAGNYITSLTGEATATGPGAAAVTLNNASVTGKVLTGVNITGGSISATDSILTAFGKVQNQINGLVGGSIYQGTWNAATNTPALASGVGTKGYYYIVSVAGTTNLDGITDWFVGDWAIFDGTAWQQVDNTDAVVSVNGQTGAVSLTTDNIPEGATNQYFLNSRARAALSFTAGSGAYNSTTGVITIPTNTSQLTNGANFITLGSLSGTAPIVYSNTTGAISITQAGTASNGYLSSTDWNTFNNKQATISLTTTGTSGAATLVGTTLNIPQYQSVLTNPVTGTGTTNYVSKWTSSSEIGNSLIRDDGTNVSVAAAPNANNKLYVLGNLGINGGNFRLGNEVSPNNEAFEFYKSSNILRLYRNAGAFGGTYTAEDVNFDLYDGTDYNVRISGAGNSYVKTLTVGSTTSPTLGVALRIQNGFQAYITSGGNPDRSYIIDTDGTGQLDFVSYPANGNAYSNSIGIFKPFNASGKDLLLMAGDSNIRFVTGGYTEVMRVNNNTTVSMYGGLFGTSAEFSSTVYAGNVVTIERSAASVPNTSGTSQSSGHRIRLTTTGAATAAIDFGTAGASGGWIQATNKADLSLKYPLLLNPNGGNVAISGGLSAWSLGSVFQINGENSAINFNGTTAIFGIVNAYYNGSAYIYQNIGSASSFEYGLARSNAFNWRMSGNSSAGATATLPVVMSLSSNGNLSIGNQNDTYKLDVSGTGRFTGALTGTSVVFDAGSFGAGYPFVFLGQTTFVYAGTANRLSTFAYNTGDKPGVELGYDITANNGIIAAATQTLGSGLDFWTYNGSSWGSRFTIAKSGAATLSNLAGSGTRMVVADASGNLSTQAIGSGSITGSGTTNYVPKFTSTSAIGNSQIFDNGTNVGIGTNLSSSFTLDVLGSVPLRTTSNSNAVSSTYGAFQIFRQSSTIGNGVGIAFGMHNSSSLEIETAYLGTTITTNTTGSEAGDLIFYTTSGGTARNERFRIQSTGLSTFAANSTTLNINTTSRVLEVIGKNSYYPVHIFGGTSAGASYGLLVQAGTNTSDRSFIVVNRADNADYLCVRGDGQVVVGPGTASTAKFAISSPVTHFSYGNNAGSTFNIVTAAAGQDGVNLVASYWSGTGFPYVNFEVGGNNAFRITPSKEFWYYAEDNTVARANIYYNNGANEYRVYATNSSGGTIGVKIMEYSGSVYYRVLTTNTGLQLTGGTLSGGLTVNSRIQNFVDIGPNDNVRTGLVSYDSTAMANGVGGQLVLGYKYTSAGDYTEGAILKMYKENGNSGDYSSGMKFQVRNTGADLSTKMVLTPSGRLLVGFNSGSEDVGKILKINGAVQGYVTSGGANSSDRWTISDTNGSNLDLVSYVPGGQPYSESMGMFVNGGKDALIMAGNANIRFVTGGYTEVARCTNSQEFLIGYIADQGAYKLQVNGAVYASAFYESSDITLKNVIKKYDSSNFGAITFNWKDNRDNKLHWGYSAQNVLEYLPDAVNINKDGKLTVDYNQAHTYKIAIIEDEVTILKRRVAELESKLQA